MSFFTFQAVHTYGDKIEDDMWGAAANEDYI